MTSEYNLSELSDVAREILSQSKSKILLFYGEMGAGKTTLIKEICSLLDIEDKISSPTFSLVNEYMSRQGESVYHFDFYRIEDEEEAMDKTSTSQNKRIRSICRTLLFFHLSK